MYSNLKKGAVGLNLFCLSVAKGQSKRLCLGREIKYGNFNLGGRFKVSEKSAHVASAVFCFVNIFLLIYSNLI